MVGGVQWDGGEEYSAMVGRSTVRLWGGVQCDGGEEYRGMVGRSTVGWWGGVQWDGGEEYSGMVGGVQWDGGEEYSGMVGRSTVWPTSVTHKSSLLFPCACVCQCVWILYTHMIMCSSIVVVCSMSELAVIIVHRQWDWYLLACIWLRLKHRASCFIILV